MSTLAESRFEILNDPSELDEAASESAGAASTEEIDLDPYYDVPCTD